VSTRRSSPPHAGELARLLGRESAWVDAHRLEAAREGAERFGAVVLLKGAGTIVQAPGGDPVVSDNRPPSLATAGTGDVLTGVVAAFLAKGLDPVTAAAAAATVHGLAAAVAPHQAGLVASDLLAELPPRSADRGTPLSRDIPLRPIPEVVSTVRATPLPGREAEV
jgi:NAD(P)H-hydrate epimerase